MPDGNEWPRRLLPLRTDGAEGPGGRHSTMSEVRMTKPLASERRRPQTLGEEIANSVSSAVGLLAVIAGIPLLVGSAIQRRNEFSLAGTIIFAVAMLSLYLVSTIYHAVPEGRIRFCWLSAVRTSPGASPFDWSSPGLRSTITWRCFPP